MREPVAIPSLPFDERCDPLPVALSWTEVRQMRGESAGKHRFTQYLLLLSWMFWSKEKNSLDSVCLQLLHLYLYFYSVFFSSAFLPGLVVLVSLLPSFLFFYTQMLFYSFSHNLLFNSLCHPLIPLISVAILSSAKVTDACLSHYTGNLPYFLLAAALNHFTLCLTVVKQVSELQCVTSFIQLIEYASVGWVSTSCY